MLKSNQHRLGRSYEGEICDPKLFKFWEEVKLAPAFDELLFVNIESLYEGLDREDSIFLRKTLYDLGVELDYGDPHNCIVKQGDSNVVFVLPSSSAKKHLVLSMYAGGYADICHSNKVAPYVTSLAKIYDNGIQILRNDYLDELVKTMRTIDDPMVAPTEYMKDHIYLLLYNTITYPRTAQKFSIILYKATTLTFLKEILKTELDIEPDNIVLYYRGRPISRENEQKTLEYLNIKTNQKIIITHKLPNSPSQIVNLPFSGGRAGEKWLTRIRQFSYLVMFGSASDRHQSSPLHMSYRLNICHGARFITSILQGIFKSRLLDASSKEESAKKNEQELYEMFGKGSGGGSGSGGGGKSKSKNNNNKKKSKNNKKKSKSSSGGGSSSSKLSSTSNGNESDNSSSSSSSDDEDGYSEITSAVIPSPNNFNSSKNNSNKTSNINSTATAASPAAKQQQVSPVGEGGKPASAPVPIPVSASSSANSAHPNPSSHSKVAMPSPANNNNNKLNAPSNSSSNSNNNINVTNAAAFSVNKNSTNKPAATSVLLNTSSTSSNSPSTGTILKQQQQQTLHPAPQLTIPSYGPPQVKHAGSATATATANPVIFDNKVNKNIVKTSQTLPQPSPQTQIHTSSQATSQSIPAKGVGSNHTTPKSDKKVDILSSAAAPASSSKPSPSPPAINSSSSSSSISSNSSYKDSITGIKNNNKAALKGVSSSISGIVGVGGNSSNLKINNSNNRAFEPELEMENSISSLIDNFLGMSSLTNHSNTSSSNGTSSSSSNSSSSNNNFGDVNSTPFPFPGGFSSENSFYISNSNSNSNNSICSSSNNSSISSSISGLTNSNSNVGNLLFSEGSNSMLALPIAPSTPPLMTQPPGIVVGPPSTMTSQPAPYATFCHVCGTKYRTNLMKCFCTNCGSESLSTAMPPPVQQLQQQPTSLLGSSDFLYPQSSPLVGVGGLVGSGVSSLGAGLGGGYINHNPSSMPVSSSTLSSSLTASNFMHSNPLEMQYNFLASATDSTVRGSHFNTFMLSDSALSNQLSSSSLSSSSSSISSPPAATNSRFFPSSNPSQSSVSNQHNLQSSTTLADASNLMLFDTDSNSGNSNNNSNQYHNSNSNFNSFF